MSTPSPVASPPAWHGLAREEALAALDASGAGLSHAEAARRLALVGPNAIATEPPPAAWVVFLNQFRSPLIYVLLIAAVVSYFVGKHHDPFVILGVVVLNALIGFFQEWQAARSLEALKRLTAPQATVLRDGEPQSVAASTLVPGDVLLLEAGDRIGADARVLSASELWADEAALTGESVPAAKTHESVAADPGLALADRRNMVFMHTGITNGRGRAVVVATGMACQIGLIASAVAGITSESPLQRRMAAFGTRLGATVLGLIGLVVLIGVLNGVPLDEIFMMAIAMAVSGIPEGLPIVVTVLLAIGVSRMAKRRALVRHLPAVEALGGATVICTDKTGTLTRNEMTVERMFTAGEWLEVSGQGYAPFGEVRLGQTAVTAGGARHLRWLAACASLCNNASLREQEGRWQVLGDPMEGALVVLARKLGFEEDWERVDEIPFSSERMWMATLHRPEGLPALGFLKGAPDRLFDLTSGWIDREGQVRPLDAAARLGFEEAAATMASQAYRVLALAALPREEGEGLAGDAIAGRAVLIGLVALLDPPRHEAGEAVAKCHRAGIQVKMITGDHLVTASAIASQLGILREGPVSLRTLDGAALERLSDTELAARIGDIDVIGRVDPLHKLRLVRALQAQGHVVAMTGDGINDAPALKAADIGVAMGINGTEVAKEASDMVLADDNFATIVAAVEEGRVIASNLAKVLQYLTSTCAGEIAIILVAIVVGLPLPLVAVQLLWINLVTDGLLDKTLALEKGEPGHMARPPRPPSAPLYPWTMLARLVPLAGTMALGTLAVFAWDLAQGASEEHARTMAFTTMVAFQWFAAFALRSLDRSLFAIGPLGNRWMLLALGAGLVLQLLALYWAPLQALLETVPLTAPEFGLAVLVASSVLLMSELAKLVVVPLARRRGVELAQ